MKQRERERECNRKGVGSVQRVEKGGKAPAETGGKKKRKMREAKVD